MNGLGGSQSWQPKEQHVTQCILSAITPELLGSLVTSFPVTNVQSGQFGCLSSLHSATTGTPQKEVNKGCTYWIYIEFMEVYPQHYLI